MIHAVFGSPADTAAIMQEVERLGLDKIPLGYDHFTFLFLSSSSFVLCLVGEVLSVCLFELVQQPSHLAIGSSP